MESLKLRLNIQSISDIITNSSSEIFCRIESKEHINEIKEFLNNIGVHANIEEDYYEPGEEKQGVIDFWIEWGDHETATDAFVAVLRKLLSDYFPEGSFEILTNVSY